MGVLLLVCSFPSALWQKGDCSPFLPWHFFFYQSPLSLVNKSLALLDVSTWLCMSMSSSTLLVELGASCISFVVHTNT